MADETIDPAQEAQDESVKSSALPDSVSTGDDPEKAAEGRGKYLKMIADNKDLAKKYGEPDFQTLLTRAGSDGAFAQMFIMSEFTDHDAPAVPSAVLPDSPQQYNVTGKLEYTGDVATKVKFDGQADNPPTAEVK